MDEECIQELKCGLSTQIIKTGSPKHLWDHFIKLQALISPHTAPSNYELDGKVPETRMTRQTADISNICEYSCYEWVMFRYQPIIYPHFPVILGQYLGTAIYIGSAMTYKIMKANGEYVCRITVCLMIPTELSCSENKELRNDFDASVAEALVLTSTVSEFDYKEYTDLPPDLDYYYDLDEDSAVGILDKSPPLPTTS